MTAEAQKDTLWTLIGSVVRNNLRWQVLSIAIGAVLLLIIIAMGVVIVNQANTISFLAKNRIMFGFPDENGVFISSEKRPENIVKRYARDFVNNMKNFDIDSVETNTKEGISMMNPEVKLLAARKYRERNLQVINNGIHQSFIIDLKTQTLEETETGYIYRATGHQKQYAATQLIQDETGWRNVEVILTKVSPTKKRQEGLWVEGGRGI